MSNPFIPKDNYISRIADRLKKEEIKNQFLYKCKKLEVEPKDIELFISENIDLPTKDLIMKAYNEFYNDANIAIKAIERKMPHIIYDMIKTYSESISKMIKSKDEL